MEVAATLLATTAVETLSAKARKIIRRACTGNPTQVRVGVTAGNALARLHFNIHSDVDQDDESLAWVHNTSAPL